MKLTSPRRKRPRGFSLVEVALALGIASFSIVTIVGFLSVAIDANRAAREEVFAAQLAHNEFSRLRALDPADLPTAYPARYYDAELQPVDDQSKAAYQFSIAFVPAVTNSDDRYLNADFRYPALAKAANQRVYHFTGLIRGARTPST